MDTRISSDRARQLDAIRRFNEQYSYVLNVPGNGESPAVPLNHNIRLQHWAGNLRTGSNDLECELRGQIQRYGKEPRAVSTIGTPIDSTTTDSMGDYTTSISNPAWNLRGAHIQYHTEPIFVGNYDPRAVALAKTSVPFQTNVDTKSVAYDDCFGKT